MTALAKSKLTPLESALLRVIPKAHGWSPVHVSLDRIMADLRTELGQQPSSGNVRYYLDGLTQRGLLTANGKGWHLA